MKTSFRSCSSGCRTSSGCHGMTLQHCYFAYHARGVNGSHETSVVVVGPHSL